MTPEAIHTVADIRQDFYTSFAAAIGLPVNITKGNSYSSNTPKITWTDRHQRANYICVYAHMAPDELLLHRPLILRLGVNQGLGLEPSKRGKASPSLGPKLLQFELTLLPSEVLKFVPWLVALFQANDTGADLELAPPCQLQLDSLKDLLTHGAWTPRAAQVIANMQADYHTVEAL